VSEDARAQVAAALEADEPTASLQVLRWAFRWSLQTIREDSLADPAEAFRATAALDDALAQGEELAGAIDRLLVTAEPGPTVEADLRRRQQRLAEVTTRIAEFRPRLQALADAEVQLRERSSEHEELRRRVEELERLERLSRGIESLEAQRQELERRVEAQAGPAQQEEQALAQASKRLLELSDQQLKDLRAETSQLLYEADRAQQAKAAALRDRRDAAERLSTEVTRLEKQLQEATERYDQLQAEREELLAPLNLYLQADQAVVEAFAKVVEAPDMAGLRPDVDSARQALGEVKRRLGEVDELLERALAEHARIQETLRAPLRPGDP
jgi:chromosome segregation ATPase